MAYKSNAGSSESKKPPPKYKWGEIKKENIKIFEYPSGEKMELVEFDGMTLPLVFAKMGFAPDMRTNLPRIKQMTARDDDVLICAYPKAGTHWLWEITKMLTKGKAEYELLPKESAMLEFHEPDEFDSVVSPRIFNTHLLFRQIPKEMVEKKCKIIYIQRNPKDVVLSFFHHTKSIVKQDKSTFDDHVSTFGVPTKLMVQRFEECILRNHRNNKFKQSLTAVG